VPRLSTVCRLVALLHSYRWTKFDSEGLCLTSSSPHRSNVYLESRTTATRSPVAVGWEQVGVQPPGVGIWRFDIRALSAPIVRGVEPGITWTCSGVYKVQILVIVPLRVCSGSQQTRAFSSELTTKRKFQHRGLSKDNQCAQISSLQPL